MGKGRGGRGFRGHKSHSHSHSHHHHHHHRGRGMTNTGLTFENSMDLLHNNAVPPTLVNGVYSFVGSEMSFRTRMQQPLNSFQNQTMQTQGLETMMLNGINPQFQQGNPFMQMNPLGNPLMQMDMPMQQIDAPMQVLNMPVQHININMVGNKTKAVDNCCFIMTMLAGSFCIFPLCFMCCTWWKKMVYPAYELSPQAYRDIGAFIERNPTANNLTLTVVDNAFNAEKARILYEALSRSRITALTFVNGALQCNGQFNEADDFKNNVLPIKSLSLTSSIQWGEMIV